MIESYKACEACGAVGNIDGDEHGDRPANKGDSVGLPIRVELEERHFWVNARIQVPPTCKIDELPDARNMDNKVAICYDVPCGSTQCALKALAEDIRNIHREIGEIRKEETRRTKRQLIRQLRE